MTTSFNLMYAADFYKVSHKAQYPDNVTKVHSVLVARGRNYNDHISDTEFQWFGLKLYLAKLDNFSSWFFSLTPEGIAQELKIYKAFLDTRLGGDNSVGHWLDLWDLGKLPLVIHAKDEFTIQPFQTPLLTVENTDDSFYWLTSFIETSMLSNIWGATTAANRAYHIRKSITDTMVGYTKEELDAVDFMGHDFSYRGMMGDEAATLSGCGHLANFKGSDTIPAIKAMEDVYGMITGFSVPATEHSVMCAGGQESERETYDRILDTYPTGIVSIVSDTWDYFSVLTDILPDMKDRIMARDGRVVIRPDSGDPVDIICGSVTPEDCSSFFPKGVESTNDLRKFARDVLFQVACDSCEHGEMGLMEVEEFISVGDTVYKLEGKVEYDRYDKQYYFVEEIYGVEVTEVGLSNEQKGSLELLDEVFGHTLDSAGLKVLDSHVGLIYGDGMNQERIKVMLSRMIAKGYSPLNLVYGIGAFTYQFTTRDELGFAFKATAVEVDGEWVNIQKSPKTDQGKKSLTGRFIGGGLNKVYGE